MGFGSYADANQRISAMNGVLDGLSGVLETASETVKQNVQYRRGWRRGLGGGAVLYMQTDVDRVEQRQS
jgi:hypothetical protein